MRKEADLAVAQQNTLMQRVTEDLWAAWRSRCLIAALELDVFTAIIRGNGSAERIATAIGASLRGTKRLLDALTGMQYLVKESDNYRLPAELSHLPLMARGALWGYVHLVRNTWDLWERLPEAVQSGQSLVKEENGEMSEKIYSRLAESLFLVHYEKARAAERQLRPRLGPHIRRVLDVAAGSAVWSIPFAQALPDVRVTAIDLPGVLPVARNSTQRMGVASNYEFIAGDVRAINLGTDAYDLIILGQIMHDLGEEESLSLLKKVFIALRGTGMLLISESMPNDERTAPVFDLLFSLNLLLCTRDGDTFTRREYCEWLREAGFSEIETLQETSSSLILATRSNSSSDAFRKESLDHDSVDYPRSVLA
jgi:ubiquinone/menaquinone biosynthesis C-methylase UbiE